ncbi:MFS transporter [Nesterenkonia ebinurensis]|uniref:MFS transporter n=1 Tax=Nesterenkonia ebinurensis TaxID=2608252 RepID=UPI00123D9ECB|nr:MFS transporter [Nesterenkonia ebinurensis]
MNDDARSPREPLGSNFRRLLPAAFSANLADGLASVAVPWIATALTRDPLLIALVVLATRLPWLLFSLPAGVIADRVDRRKLIVWMDMLRAAAIGGFAVVVLFYQQLFPDPEAVEAGLAEPPAGAGWFLAALYIAALTVGSAEVLRDNAAQTLLPSLVKKSQLKRANGRLWGAEITADSFIGPPLAGVLLGLALVVPFGATALLFLVSGLLMMSIRGSFSVRTATDPQAAPATTWRADLAEGLRWLWGHRLLRSLAISLGVMNGAMTAAFASQVLFAQEILGLDATGFGVLLTGAAAGALLGSFTSEHITARTGDGATLRMVLVLNALCLAGIGLSSHAAPVWALLTLFGLLVVTWNVVTVSLRQRIIPDHLLGRVNSVYRFFGWGMMSIGAVAGGVVVTVGEPLIGREWALRSPLLMAGLCCLLLIPYLWHRASSAVINAARAGAEGTAST